MVPGPGYWSPRPEEAPLPYDSRMEMRSGEWEWRTLYYRGRHSLVDSGAEGAAALFDKDTGLTLLGDLVFLYTPTRVLLMVILRSELEGDQFEDLHRWLSGQLDNGERDWSVEYFLGAYLKGLSGPPLRPPER